MSRRYLGQKRFIALVLFRTTLTAGCTGCFIDLCSLLICIFQIESVQVLVVFAVVVRGLVPRHLGAVLLLGGGSSGLILAFDLRIKGLPLLADAFGDFGKGEVLRLEVFSNLC